MKETFSAKKFNDTYKDFVRDYYTYGFKSYEQFSKSKKTVNDFWKLLRATLGDFEYESGKNGRSRIVLTTPETVAAENPLDRLYFRNGIDKTAYFGELLCLLLGLDSDTVLRSGFASLQLEKDELEKLWLNRDINDEKPTRYVLFDNWFKEIESEDPQTGLFDAGEKGKLRVRNNEQLMTLTWKLWDGYDPDKPNMKPLLEDRMKFPETCGIFGNLKNDTKLRDRFLMEIWKRSNHPDSARRAPQGKGGESGIDYWYLSTLTMQELLDAAPADADGSAQAPFAGNELQERLSDLCGFFAQYYPLGELGTLLKRRIAGSVLSDEETAEGNGLFTFRQNYMQKVLYDYNLVDLLIAIEHDGSAEGEDPYLCRITSRHGTNKSIEECLVRPLEIRISVRNGREYLMSYDVIGDRILAMRLEFIDDIVVYRRLTKVKIVQYLQDSGKKGAVSEAGSKDLDPERIRAQAKIAKEMLPFIWGVNDLRNTGECRVDASWRERLQTYRIRIACEEDEDFIRDRIKKEDRILPDAGGDSADEDGWTPEAEEEIRKTCFPTNEFRTWLRSYYVRVLGTEHVNDDVFTVRRDVEDMWNVYFGDRVLQGRIEREQKTAGAEVEAAQRYYYGYEEDRTEKPADRQRMPVYEGHDALFNWMFSDYAAALADAVLENSAKDRGEQDFGMDLDYLVERIAAGYDPGVWKVSVDELIDETVDSLREIADESELVMPDGSKFLTSKRSYLRELLPLTKLESRWLMTALCDPLAEIFFPRKMRDAMLRCIRQKSPQEIRPFSVDAIHYFDRYNKITADGEIVSGKEDRPFSAAEIDAARKIYEAMRTRRRIRVTFDTAKGRTHVWTIEPLRIEYSRRDNQMRVRFPHRARSGEIEKWTIILSAVKKAQILQEGYDPDESRASVQPYLDAQRTGVQVEFYEGDRNLPDRILTEFSSWKKTCVYEPDSGKFVMTLYYSKEEEREILVRLLAYGPFIRVSPAGGEPDEDNYVCSELKRRVEKQRDRLLTAERMQIRSRDAAGRPRQ